MEKKNIKDLGFANGWSEDSVERKLVEKAKNAGYRFKETFIPPHTFEYVCEEAGLKYRTNCS